MRPIVTDRVAWSVSLSVCLSVCHTGEPCKNGCTDRGAVWVEDAGGPKEPDPSWEKAILMEKGRPLVKYRDTLRWSSCAKTAEPIDMPFGLRIRVGPRNYVLNGVHIQLLTHRATARQSYVYRKLLFTIFYHPSWWRVRKTAKWC